MGSTAMTAGYNGFYWVSFGLQVCWPGWLGQLYSFGRRAVYCGCHHVSVAIISASDSISWVLLTASLPFQCGLAMGLLGRWDVSRAQVSAAASDGLSGLARQPPSRLGPWRVWRQIRPPE